MSARQDVKCIPVTVTHHSTGVVTHYAGMTQAAEALGCNLRTLQELVTGDRAYLGYTVAYRAIEPAFDEKGTPETWLPLDTALPFFVSSIPNLARFARLVGTPGRPIYVPVMFTPYADGYYRVRNKTGKVVLLHHLVWNAFEGAIPLHYEIKHLDGNPLNNAINNLIALPCQIRRPVREAGILVTGKRFHVSNPETIMAKAALEWMGDRKRRRVQEDDPMPDAKA